MFGCFTSFLAHCTFFNHTIKKIERTPVTLFTPLVMEEQFHRGGCKVTGAEGGRELCQSSKRSLLRAEIGWKVVEGVGVGEECQRVIPVGQCRGRLDMKVEVVGHSVSALHPNAKRHGWEANEGRFVGAGLEENRS